MKKQEKTNVMRLLDQQGVSYESHCYEGTGAVSGAEVAAVLGQDPERVFKTLVTEGKSGQHYVFVIPVLQELLPLTGYIHGGCSPIGMKKPFPTCVEESAILYDRILFSAGKIGYQVELPPDELAKLTPFQYADLCE